MTGLNVRKLVEDIVAPVWHLLDEHDGKREEWREAIVGKLKELASLIPPASPDDTSGELA